MFSVILERLSSIFSALLDIFLIILVLISLFFILKLVLFLIFGRKQTVSPEQSDNDYGKTADNTDDSSIQKVPGTDSDTDSITKAGINTTAEITTNEQGGAYIFISYTHKTKEKTFAVVKKLQSNGYRVWLDIGLEAGSHYNDIIAAHIEKCEVFCCLLSEDYYLSDYCRQEFNYAKEDLNKPIIPIFVGKTSEIKATLPSGIRMWLSGVHAIELEPIETFISKIEMSSLLSNCKIGSGADS